MMYKSSPNQHEMDNHGNSGGLQWGWTDMRPLSSERLDPTDHWTHLQRVSASHQPKQHHQSFLHPPHVITTSLMTCRTEEILTESSGTEDLTFPMGPFWKLDRDALLARGKGFCLTGPPLQRTEALLG